MYNNHNPYANRRHLPVGQLDYQLSSQRALIIRDLKPFCMLEFGEQEILFDIPRILGLGGSYVNLGHALGGSAMLLARGLKDQGLNGLIHSVDTFDNEKNHRTKADNILQKFDMLNDIKLYQGPTNLFSDAFGSITFLFIDADHSYDGVLSDFSGYAPKVIQGGALAFHDTNQDYTHRVIEENLTNNPIWQQVCHVNRIKVFKKV